MTGLRVKFGAGALLALAGALPAAAQTGLCGGVGDNGQWIGGTEAASDISTAPAFMEQMALVLMNNEYVSLFTVSSPTDVRVEAEGRGAGDPVIDLRDAAGNIVLSDDDSGGNGASRGEIFLEPGTYCLSMKSYDGAPMTGFVRVGLLGDEPLTDGLGEIPIDDFPIDDPYAAAAACDATMITAYLADGPIDGLLTSGGAVGTASVNEVPYWGFTLAAPSAVTITATNEAADPYITLYDEYSGYIAENDDYDGLNSLIDVTYPLAAGTYCIAMSALTDTSMPITVSVTGYDAAAAMIGMYDRAEASPPMDGSYPVTALGPLGNRLRSDVTSTDVATWFSVEVGESGILLVEAVTNGLGDPTLVVFDDFGRQIAYNDDSGDTLDSLVTARVQPGTYMVAVKQLGEGSSALTRLLFERYVPAQ